MVIFNCFRVSNPSIHGALVGIVLTTIIYVLFSSSQTLWKREGGLNSEEFKRYDDLVFGHSDILEQLHTSGIKGDNVFHGRKETLLSVVAVSKDQIESTTQLINKTWGQSSKGWKVAMGTKGGKVVYDKKPSVFEAQECEDFTIEHHNYMNTQKLFCLLKAIHEEYLFDHKWFLIATSSLYISMAGLERFLMNMDPDESVYIGTPDSNGGRYCSGRTGILISQTALERVVPHLDSCLQASAALNDSVSSDVILGACFSSKLFQSCYSFDKYSRKKDETLYTQSPEFESYYGDHFVVYPADQTLMRALHMLHQKGEVAYHDNKAKEYENKLFNSPICNTPYLDIDVPFPINSSEIKTWNVVNPNSSYYSGRLEPQEWYDGDVRLELDSLMKQGLLLLNKTDSHYPKSARVTYGLFRHRGTRGREVILDVETKNKTNKKINRIHLIRPHELKPVLLEDAGPEAINKTIDFIVPLSNVRSRFTEFMKIYENLCLRDEEKCRLNLVVYGSSDIAVIKSNLTLYKKKYPTAQFVVIPGTGQFSRGRALHTGISTLKKSDLAFTCDVDMTIERDFLNRCRRNAIEGRRVYYPQVFKYYNMDYVYKFRGKPAHGYDISRNHGHWCTYGYGMLCIYKSDYDYVGGYDSTIEGWGGEDILLSDKVIELGLEVMRAPDPSLLHRYHPKVCSRKLTKSQYYQCLSSRNEDIADRRRLADYIFYMENKCHIQKKKWD